MKRLLQVEMNDIDAFIPFKIVDKILIYLTQIQVNFEFQASYTYI